jgi:hypothetical protein
MDTLNAPLQDMLPWNVRVGITFSTAVVSSAYLHALPRCTKPSLLRWCLGLPVLVINMCLPLLFDSYEELLTRVSVVFMLTWLGSFKVSRSASARAMWCCTCSGRLQTNRRCLIWCEANFFCATIPSCDPSVFLHADSGAMHEQRAPNRHTDLGADSNTVPAACLS